MKTVMQLRTDLLCARSEHDLYRTCRCIIQLREHYSDSVNLTADERQALEEMPQQARDKVDQLSGYLPRGYALARWFMLIAYFLPDSDIRPTHDDLKIMLQAGRRYLYTQNFEQLASLIHSCNYFGASLNITMTPEEAAGVEHALERIS